LVALAAEPGLWQRHKGGDDCLLLRREDFLSPDRSLVLKELISLRDGRARAAATLFKSLLAFSPDQVPAIDDRAIAVPVPGAVPAPSLLPSWIADHLPDGPRHPTSANTGNFSSNGGAAWLLDHLPGAPGTTVDWGSLTWQRASLGLSPAVAAALAFLLTYSHPIHWSASPIMMALLNLAALRVAYDHSAPAKARAAAAHKASTARAELDEIEVTIRQLEAKARTNASATNEARHTHVSGCARLESARDAQLEAARKTYQSVADAQGRKRQQINRDEQNEMQRTTSAAATSLSRIQQELADVVRAEDADVQREILKLQQEQINDALRRTSLTYVPTGRRYLDLLHDAGIRTAFDATDTRVASVYGIGPKTEAAIRRWRSDIITRARGRVGNALPPSRDAQIRAPFAQDRARLQGEVAAGTQQHQQLVAAVRSRFDALRVTVDVELRRALPELQARERNAHADCTRQIETVTNASRRSMESLSASTKQIEQDLGRIRKQRFDAVLKHQLAVRGLEQLENARFTGYLKRVVGLA